MKRFLSSIYIVMLATVSVTAQYVNPLERWATHNLDGLNSFATGDQATSKGKMYQFGRNIPMASEGAVNYWGNPDGSVTHERVWSIHLINNYNSTGNWYGTGAVTDTWESIVAQTAAAETAPTTYIGTNDGSPAPVGWHIPNYAEMKALIPFVGNNEFAYASVSKRDMLETSVDIVGDGTIGSYTSDFQTVDANTVVARRFKGTEHETAYRYEYINTSGEEVLKISAKASGDATIDAILSWTGTDWSNAVVRYFPAAGFRASGSSALNNSTEGYYWAGTVDESNTGRAYYYTFSSTVFRGTSYFRCNAFLIRCVKDYKDETISGDCLVFDKTSVWQGDNQIYVSGDAIAGQTIRVYNSAGISVHVGKAVGNQYVLTLPRGVYVVKVGTESIKTIVK